MPPANNDGCHRAVGDAHEAGRRQRSTSAIVTEAVLGTATHSDNSMRPCKPELVPQAPIAAAMAAFDERSKQRQWASRSGTQALGVPCDEHVPASGAAPEPGGPVMVPWAIDRTALRVACNEETRLPPHGCQQLPSPSNDCDEGPDPVLASASVQRAPDATICGLQEHVAGSVMHRDARGSPQLWPGADLVADS